MEDNYRIEIDMDQDICFDCKKNSPEYYELKIQIRCLFFEDLDEIKNEVFNLVDKHFTKINKLQELSNGFDFFFRSKGEMNKVTSVFNRRYLIEEKRSKKIVGQNSLESKSIWRHIVLLNIINLERGDRIGVKKDSFVIKAINHNDLILINEITRSKKVVSYRFIKDYLELLEKVDREKLKASDNALKKEEEERNLKLLEKVDREKLKVSDNVLKKEEEEKN